MGDANETCASSKLSDRFYVTAFSVIFLLGLLFNSLALVFFFRFTKIRSQTTVYMKNLACADLLLVGSLPVRILYYVTRQPLPPLLCELTGLVFLVNMYGSIFFLTCISLDRCVAICFPMKSRLNSLRGRAKWISAGVWLLVVGASIPPYLAIPKAGNETGACTLCFDKKPTYVTNPATVAPTLLVGYGIPLGTILACSLSLLRAVRRSSATRMDYVDWRKIRNMVAANVVIFVVCFLPYHTVLLLYVAVRAPEREPTLRASYRAAIAVACLNAIFDPLAYYFVTETFQKSVGMKALKNALTSNTDSAEGNNRSLSPQRAKQVDGKCKVQGETY
ncbi:lysophosphatidic acid receptor 6-like isoform X4 [Stegostoma tigrinum]|uniref:lysophosphatidic acid receptor 6-like isoform X4 n=1 Tax=Stegostoma tigrinum TaxID=3053191 RepID=UPI00202AFE65|nr:lysophosphatidic acid receptor 6-like isoform X4 [Stegostoma tigrinum]